MGQVEKLSHNVVGDDVIELRLAHGIGKEGSNAVEESYSQLLLGVILDLKPRVVERFLASQAIFLVLLQKSSHKVKHFWMFLIV